MSSLITEHATVACHGVGIACVVAAVAGLAHRYGSRMGMKKTNIAAALLVACGVSLVTVALVRVFGPGFLWGFGLCLAGLVVVLASHGTRIKEEGLIEYLNLGEGPRNTLLHETLLKSLQEDQILKKLRYLARTYLPFVIVGKYDQALTQKVMDMMPADVQTKLQRNGMIHFLPPGVQKALLGRRHMSIVFTDDLDLASTSGASDASLATAALSTADATSVSGEQLAGSPGSARPTEADSVASSAEGRRPRSAESAPSTGETDSEAHSPSDDVLKFIFREKWKQASTSLAGSALGKVQLALLAAVVVQLAISGGLRRRLWKFSVRFGFAGTVLGLFGSYALARLVDAGHNTQHSEALVHAVKGGVQTILQMSGKARMAATAIVFWVFRRWFLNHNK